MSDLRDSLLWKKASGVVMPVIAGVSRRIQSSGFWFILLATGIGLIAGATSALLAHTAHALQRLLYGFSADMRLSALPEIEPWHLIALPLGGAVLAAIRALWPNRTRAPIDVIEANALYGGRIPLRDSLVVSLQTLISNGFGVSVGLEAAFAQMGGGVASKIGQRLNLKRSSLRTLVGAGAGSAIAAAFGAPLAGAFYAFEIVLGGYNPRCPGAGGGSIAGGRAGGAMDGHGALRRRFNRQARNRHQRLPALRLAGGGSGRYRHRADASGGRRRKPDAQGPDS